jgi:uncharacterized protein YggE
MPKPFSTSSNPSVQLLMALLGSLLLGYFAFTVSAAAQMQNAKHQDTLRTVSVSGHGQVTVQPDMAVIVLGVQTDAHYANVALAQNNKRMQALISLVKKQGVAAADIQTQAIRLQPRYSDERRQPGKPTLEVIGYTALNTLELRVRDLPKLGELLNAAVQSGGNTIQGLRFALSDPGPFVDKARVAAISDARHKAEQLAALTSVTLGKVLTLTESSAIPAPFSAPLTRAEAAAVPIEPGTQTVEVSVQVTWLLR